MVLLTFANIIIHVSSAISQALSNISLALGQQPSVTNKKLLGLKVVQIVIRVMVKNGEINIQIIYLRMVKQTIFELIHELQNSRRNQTYFPTVMYITNLLIHITIYLSIPSLSMLNIASVMGNGHFILVLAVLTLILVLQLFIYLLKRAHLKLSHQLSIYRFILSPLLAYSILHASKNGLIGLPLALIAFVCNKIFSSLVSRLVIYEQHRNYTLNIMETSIVFQFDTFQILLISNCFIFDSTQIIFAGLTLGSALLSTYRHFLHIESEKMQYKILHYANITHIIIMSFYLSLLIFHNNHPGFTFIAITPLLFLVFFAIKNKKKSIQNNIQRLLSIDLSFQDFLQAVDCFLILTKRDSSQHRKRKLINYIFAIISHHRSKCIMPHCQLENPSTHQQLKNISSKSLLQLTHKILKKIQWILEVYHSKGTDNIIISFVFLKFYSQYIQNKIKMQKLLNQINHQNLSWAQQLQLYKYQEICVNIQNIDNIDVIKDDEIYIEFQNGMIATLNCMIEFWSEFSEEKVDLGKIMSISAKLFPHKAKVQEIFQSQLKNQKFTTFKILKLYSLYLRRILNKFQLASRVQDIQTILSNLLRDKQDIQYLSKESEAGFVVICLSESKLGDIFMVNQKACDIFRYTKKQMLGLRVNAIMPSVIAQIHDQILIDFLKKKRKQFNTDQRLLFGKDGNGYVFPVELQLQRASFSSNDQYIFIASVAPARLRSAPVFCIVDHEGEITDFTAPFRNIFFQNLTKKSYNRNIQEIIPTYFDSEFNQKSTNVRKLTQYINNRKLGDIQAKFQIVPLIVKTVHEGFLVKMQYNNQKTASNYRNLCFSENMKHQLIKGEAMGMQNSYNHLVNYYQISSKLGKINLRPNGPQFTLPFLSYQDMAYFANSTDVKTYSKDIKTIRLVHNHFERIDQQASFHSQSFANDDKVDIRAKIEQFKHKFNKQQDQSIILLFKILINIIIILAIIMAFFTYTVFLNEAQQEKQFLQSFDNQKRILYYLPQYIISFTCANAGINAQYFLNHLQAIKPVLVDNILQSDIQQILKQQIMKIIYLKSPYELADLLQTNTFTLAQSDQSVDQLLTILWSVLVGISILFFLIFILMFYYFHQILFSIYTLFLSLKQSSIKRIEESCKQLIQKIYFQSQESVQKDEEKKAIEEEEQNQLQKIKQFKNMSRKQDFYNFLKLVVPLLFIICFSLIMLFTSRNQFKLYQTLKEQHNTMFEAIPATSIEFTKIVLKIIDSISLKLDNNYDLYYQELQMTILQFNQNSQTSNYLNLMYGNLCINSKNIRPDMALSCNTLGNGILTSGIASTMNFIAQQLKNIANKNKITNDDAELIFSLQFSFINPALMAIEDSMQDSLLARIETFCSFFSSMAILLIFLYVIYDIYLLLYPLKDIQNEIRLTNQMISLMPDNAGQEISQSPHPQ